MSSMFYLSLKKYDVPNSKKKELGIREPKKPVFRKIFLIRSSLFIILYILLIKSNASIITAIPLAFLLVAVYAISNLALRENMEEFDKALSNINDIDKIKWKNVQKKIKMDAMFIIQAR